MFRREVVFEDMVFGCAEAAYQWGKPRDAPVRDWLMVAPRPALMKAAADALPFWAISSGWYGKHLDRMREVQRAKFGRHADLRRLLLASGDARLVYELRMARRKDYYSEALEFGEFEGQGLNRLGVILMEVRGELGGRGVVEREEQC